MESQRVHHRMEEELGRVKQVSHTCSWRSSQLNRGTWTWFGVILKTTLHFSLRRGFFRTLEGPQDHTKEVQLSFLSLLDLKMTLTDTEGTAETENDEPLMR